MRSKLGPIVIFKCKFCNWEHESPWVYSPWPPIDLEEYYAWLDMVGEYKLDDRVESVCENCKKRGLSLEIFGIREKVYSTMNRSEEVK